MTDSTDGDPVANADVEPIDQLAEVLIYAPLGLALEARRLFPGLVDRGRGQVKLARATGRRAVRRYRMWAENQVDEARREAGAALRGLGLAPADDPDHDEARSPLASGVPSNGATVEARPVPDRVVTTPAEGPAIDVDTLAIPDYDHLSASQVVPRLAGLVVDELEAVRGYEAQHRGRKTILNKIAQLQAG